MERRQFLHQTLRIGKGLAYASLLNLFPRELWAMGEISKFRWTQLIYRGQWDPRPNASKRLMWELMKRTSVEAKLEPASIRLTDKALFYHPFLCLAGAQEFSPFSEEEIRILRRYLSLGGFMLIDDCQGVNNSGFSRSVQREIARVFPQKSWERIGQEHTVLRSFYLLDRAAGRVLVSPYLEGINIDDRTPIIYSRNDLSGAWSRDDYGNWEYEVVPGGESQREMTFRLGINIVMYALAVNYKKDQIHQPFILQRKR
ncbi:MAG: DUF4159 domain-containing protein [Deltaproteobacteria bacterium]|nr:MAG: DUF4159 domain-containing protein [Deltaproteobacteria bacterium]